MSTEVNNPSKPSAYSSHTKSNIPKIFSYSVEITNAPPLIGFMGSMMNVSNFKNVGKRRYTIKLWKTFTDCFNCLPVAALIDEKILCMHGGLSPELSNLE
jgi:hypothetical protein